MIKNFIRIERLMNFIFREINLDLKLRIGNS
jgi:hypothetical protein